MTHEEALQLLQLGAGNWKADEIRRAYLRRVKVVKPEADPEGFSRLREAYEYLRQPTSLAPDLPAPLASTGAGAAEAPPPRAPDPFEPYRLRLAGLPYHKQIAIAREALAALPDSTEARWCLLSFLTDPASSEAVHVLAEGAARNPAEFLDELLWRFPDRVPPDTLQAAATGAGSARQLLLADVHAEQLRPIEALAQLHSALAASEPGGPFALTLAVRPIFTMHARMQLDAAQKALALVKEFAGPLGLDVTRVAPEAAVLFTIADELGRLGPELPFALRQVVARAAKNVDFAAAPYDARVAARTLGPRQTRRWRKRLSEQAPTVGRILALDLSEAQIRPAGVPSFRPLFGIPILPVIYLVGRFLFGMLDTDPPVRPPPALHRPSPATAARVAAETVAEACGGKPRHAACGDLTKLVGDMMGGQASCELLRMRFGLLSVSSLDAIPPNLQVALVETQAALNARCPP